MATCPRCDFTAIATDAGDFRAFSAVIFLITDSTMRAGRAHNHPCGLERLARALALSVSKQDSARSYAARAYRYARGHRLLFYAAMKLSLG